MQTLLSPSGRIEHCNGTYSRDVAGVWRYRWGDAVSGAIDLVLADVVSIRPEADLAECLRAIRPVTAAEREWLAGGPLRAGQAFVRVRDGAPPHPGDLVVGMMAPELLVTTMLNGRALAALAGVSKDTVDSYRYRGLLPEPQVTWGRTRLWARPVVTHWIAGRSGHSGHAGRTAQRERQLA